MQQVCFVGFLLNFRRGHLSAMGCRVRFQQAVFVLLRQTFLLRGTQQPYEPLFMCFFPGISPSSQSSSRGQLVGLESFSAVSVCAQGCVYICVDFVLTTATREGNQSPGEQMLFRATSVCARSASRAVHVERCLCLVQRDGSGVCGLMTSCD